MDLMPLPSLGCSLLVRTAFDDDAAWDRLRTAVRTPTVEGFLADVEFVDDPAHHDATPDDLRSRLPPDEYVSFLFVADARTLADAEYPVLAVPVPRPECPFLDEPPRRPFRAVAAELYGPENNLSMSNMDWYEFADAVDPDGVFRGFP